MRHIRDHLREHTRFTTPVGEDSPTQQHFKDECTVSLIVKRFQRTGIMPVNTRQPLYGDFTEATDLHSAMNLVLAAQADFDALDARVRAVAQNDPREFLKLLATDEGCDALEAAGLPLERPTEAKKERKESKEEAETPPPEKDDESGSGNGTADQ